MVPRSSSLHSGKRVCTWGEVTVWINVAGARTPARYCRRCPCECRKTDRRAVLLRAALPCKRAADPCLQLKIAQVPNLRRVRWIGGLPCSSLLKQGGPWLTGMHVRKRLVPVSLALPQAHREVASEVVWCLTVLLLAWPQHCSDAVSYV